MKMIPGPIVRKPISIPYPAPDGNIGTHPALILTDAADITGRFEFTPSDFLAELSEAYLIVVPGGTGNMRWSLRNEFGKVGSAENYNSHIDTIAASEIAVTLNRLELIDILAAFTALEALDTVGIEFIRHGSHVNDTVNAPCYLLGFKGIYKEG